MYMCINHEFKLIPPIQLQHNVVFAFSPTSYLYLPTPEMRTLVPNISVMIYSVLRHTQNSLRLLHKY